MPKVFKQDPTLPQGFSNTFRDRFWAKVNKTGPFPDPVKYPNLVGCCWVWTAYSGNFGYGQINPGRLTESAGVIRSHRASWLIHFGLIPDDKWVLHHCDNSRCIRPGHLWLGTRQDNIDDCLKKDRASGGKTCGENHYSHKLVATDIPNILKLYPGMNYNQIAKKFGVNNYTIASIINGITWKHIERPNSTSLNGIRL